MEKFDEIDFIDAIINDDYAMVCKALEAGMNPNLALDQDRIMPLHFAAQHDAYNVIPFLVNAGADLYARMVHDDSTPFDVAVLFGHHKTARILMYYMEQQSYTRH